MPFEAIVGALMLIANDLLKARAAEAVDQILELSPVQRALDSLRDDPAVDAEIVPLEKWVGGAYFKGLLESIAAGSPTHNDDQLIENFISETGFYGGTPDETVEAAQHLLAKFLEWVKYHLYTSKGGPYFQANRFEDMHRETTSNFEILMQKVDTVASRLPRDDVSTINSEEKTFHGRIDAARQLILGGKTRAARDILEGVRKETADKASPDLQFRIATNYGACLVDEGAFEEALKEFERSAILKPEKSSAHSNLATVATVLRRADQALEASATAVSLDANDPHAMAVRLRAAHTFARETFDELLHEVDADAAPAEVCVALGEARFEDREFEEAEAWLRRGIALSAGSEHPDTHSLLSVAIFRPLQAHLTADPPTLQGPTKDQLERLLEAEESLTKAIETLSEWDNRERLLTALSNRAGIRSLRGDTEGARSDLDRALAEEPRRSEVLFNRALLAFLEDDETTAAKLFRRIPDYETKGDVVVPLAASLATLGTHTEAVRLLRPFWKGDPSDPLQIRVADLLLATYVGGHLSPDELLEGVLESLEQSFEQVPRALSAVGRYKLRTGAVDEGLELLRRAAAAESGNAKTAATLELADELRRQGRAAEAVGAYGDLVDTSEVNPLTTRYLVALYDAGAYKEALDLATTLRGEGRAIPTVTEVEVYIREFTGDLETATTLLVDLAEVTGEDKHLLNAAILEMRRDRREQALALVRQTNVSNLKTADVLMQCAHLRMSLGEPQALDLAYEARRKAFGDPDIHVAYVELVLGRERIDGTELSPDRVDVDTAVKLRRGEEEKTFTILQDESASLERGELRPEDDLAQRLLGARAGDRVTLKDVGIEELVYEVIEVQSKFVAAFQQTLLNFTTWWPSHPGIQMGRTEDNDFAKLFSILDARERLVTHAMQVYRDRGLPLGTVASATGGSLIDVWKTLIGTKDQVLLVSSGNSEDLETELTLALQHDRVILDLSAVLSILLLDAADDVFRTFDQVLISQSARDTVLNDYVRDFEGAMSSAVIGKHEDQYFHHEISKTEREAAREFAQRARSLLDRCTTVPTTAALQVGPEEAARMANLIGPSSVGTVLLAQGEGLVAWIDDLPLKNLAATEWKVEAFSIQGVLRAALKNDVIDEREYANRLRTLLLSNYVHIAVTASDLWTMLEDDEMRVTPAWAHVLERTLGPTSHVNSAAIVAASLLRVAWLAPLPEARKGLILDSVLTAVIAGRSNPTQAAATLRAAVSAAFALLPLHATPILKSIDYWAVQRRRTL